MIWVGRADLRVGDKVTLVLPMSDVCMSMQVVDHLMEAEVLKEGVQLLRDGRLFSHPIGHGEAGIFAWDWRSGTGVAEAAGLPEGQSLPSGARLFLVEVWNSFYGERTHVLKGERSSTRGKNVALCGVPTILVPYTKQGRPIEVTCQTCVRCAARRSEGAMRA